jgi:coenzyme F420-0:L-glutamate ligase/coenzyme F420-1:gamma-L-glutamate ligase
MKLYPIKTQIVKIGDNLSEVILKALKKQSLQLENNDVLALTSKIVSQAEGRTADLKNLKPSEQAKKIAEEFSLQPEFAELILREADKIYGGVDKAVLTLKNGILTPNAGIDNKNAPAGIAILWPSSPEKSAESIREEIRSKTGKRIAVLIVDSGLVPLRRGTAGFALAVAGFKPIKDRRGDDDLYGKKIVITTHAVADDLASAAHLLMGEAAERTPAVLIREAPVDFDEKTYGSADMMMPFKECIFMNAFADTTVPHSRGRK